MKWLKKLALLESKKSPYLLNDNEIVDRVRELRLPVTKEFGEKGSLTEIFTHYDPEKLRELIIRHEHWIREERLWLIAVISGIASVISALAAWAAVLYGSKF